ncbi:unnamed protein product [Oncorhynchus mykiss]|uniref:WH1 domain-containing protein n=1 Tax=Oncorhynchus mykiss TaxID=8022 RepID=A0A060XAC3_ONCMY|nr:unnamed protein product [Oncorhynchus mykiss]
MNSHPPQRRVGNIGSILLTPQENECLFNYLGRKCITLCTAVVQVYGADRSSSWVKRCCGVACLIKDNPLRSYFIRVFDIKEGKTMFEQELYNNFSINSSRSYFISFSGDNCQVGLNFASEEEAKRFRAALKDLLSRRQRKTGNYSGPTGSVYTPSAFSSPQPLTLWTGKAKKAQIYLTALLLTTRGPIPNHPIICLRCIFVHCARPATGVASAR